MFLQTSVPLSNAGYGKQTYFVPGTLVCTDSYSAGVVIYFLVGSREKGNVIPVENIP